MKILLILVLAISGCTVKVDHTSSGTVRHEVSFAPEVMAWLETFAATEEGESCLGSMPDEVQQALYGYVVYPNQNRRLL